MTDYQFTKDWFHWAPQVWEQLIPLLPEGETFGAADHGVRQFLEIGSFEGRSTVWIMENMARKGDRILCIDTWKGGEEHGGEDMAAVWKRFKANTEIAARKTGVFVGIARGTSVHHLAGEIEEDQFSTYDFIYIDGSHVAKDVLTDACMAWPLLKQGGIMVFDDYAWGDPRDILHRPKIAIDAFMNIFAEEVELIHMGYQAIIKKK